MGLLISKPIGKLSRISIRVLLVIFKKEVIEKKVFNTLTKLAWGHGSQGGFSSPYPWTPSALCPAGPLSSSPLLAVTPGLGHPTSLRLYSPGSHSGNRVTLKCSSALEEEVV